MKKRIAAMSLALVMMFAVTSSAFAMMPRWNSTLTCSPSLTFTGTTANCQVVVYAINGASISGTMTLYRISSTTETKVASWDISGTTRLNTTKKTTVTKGQTYKLVVDINVSGADGNDHLTDSVTSTC